MPVQKGPSSSGLPAGANSVCTQGVSREEDEWSSGNPEKSQLWLYTEPGALLMVTVSVFLPSLCGSFVLHSAICNRNRAEASVQLMLIILVFVFVLVSFLNQVLTM